MLLEKFQIGRKKLLFKEIFSLVPTKYEKIKLFTFNIQSKFIKGKLLYLKGFLRADQESYMERSIVLAAKLSKICLVGSTILLGDFNETNDLIFFPKLINKKYLHLSEEENFLISYKNWPQSTNFYIKQALNFLISNPNIKELISNLIKIHSPQNENEINEGFKQLFNWEINAYLQYYQLKNKKEIYKLKIYDDPHFSESNNEFSLEKQNEFSLEKQNEFSLEKQNEFSLEKQFIATAKKLSFQLRESQLKVLMTISKELMGPLGLRHLVHGEVGSGKTLVSFLIALLILRLGKNVAFLTPSKLVAQQVYNNIKKWLEILKDSDGFQINAEFIVSKSGKEKSFNPTIFIGTHSLFFKEIQVDLLIIDEQQKFSIRQRQIINAPNILMTTATPIPRTFKMTQEGLLNISSLSGPGFERKILIDKEENLETLVQDLMHKKMNLLLVTSTISEAEQFYNKFKSYSPFIIHSKNRIDLTNYSGFIIATSIIEVGIDLDLDYVIIYGADHFGLAQLHQIRGRVARHKAGTCVLIGKNKEKLNLLQQAENSEQITKLDMQLRGFGDLFAKNNKKQSGNTHFIFNKIYENNFIMEMEFNNNYIKSPIPISWCYLFIKNFNKSI